MMNDNRKPSFSTVYSAGDSEEGGIELKNAIMTLNEYIEGKVVEKQDLNEGILTLLRGIAYSLTVKNSPELNEHLESINLYYYKLLCDVVSLSQSRPGNLVDISYEDNIFLKSAHYFSAIPSGENIGKALIKLFRENDPRIFSERSMLGDDLDEMSHSNFKKGSTLFVLDGEINREAFEKNSAALHEFVDGKIQGCPGDITKMVSSVIYYITYLCELENDKKQIGDEEAINKNIELLSKIFERKYSLQWGVLFEDSSVLYYAVSIARCKGFEKTAYKVVDLLLKNGDENAIKQSLNNAEKYSPLHRMCSWLSETEFKKSNSQQILNIIKRLLKAGADPNLRDNSQCTSLRIAEVHGLLEITSLLVIFQELEEIDENGCNALHRAVKNNKPLSEIRKIINNDIKKLDINAKDKGGNTALHYARDIKIFEFLINKGASPNVINMKNNKPFKPQTYSSEVAAEFLGEKALSNKESKRKKGNKTTKPPQSVAKKNPAEKTMLPAKAPVKKTTPNSTKQQALKKKSGNCKEPKNSQKQPEETNQPSIVKIFPKEEKIEQQQVPLLSDTVLQQNPEEAKVNIERNQETISNKDGDIRSLSFFGKPSASVLKNDKPNANSEIINKPIRALPKKDRKAEKTKRKLIEKGSVTFGYSKNKQYSSYFLVRQTDFSSEMNPSKQVWKLDYDKLTNNINDKITEWESPESQPAPRLESGLGKAGFFRDKNVLSEQIIALDLATMVINNSKN